MGMALTRNRTPLRKGTFSIPFRWNFAWKQHSCKLHKYEDADVHSPLVWATKELLSVRLNIML